MDKHFSEMTVLIVDDDENVREMLKNMLREIGLRKLVEARDGTEGVSAFQSKNNPVDIVLCDWNMPDMNGMEVMRHIRKLDGGGDCPFMMVTGRSDMDSVVEAKQAGVVAYIRKPFSVTQLEQKLKFVYGKMILDETKTG